MTAELAVPSGGAAIPGSLYGRSGPRPRKLLDASGAAQQAVKTLQDQLRNAGGATLADCVPVTAALRQAARIYTGCLTAEALISSTALTPDLAAPRPAVAESVRADLKQGVREAGAAGSEVFTAWRALRGLTAGTAGENPAGRATAAVISTADVLAGELKAASRQVIPASEPMVHGHATVAYHLALALIGLREVSLAVAGLAHCTPRKDRGQNKVTGPLHEAGELFRKSSNSSSRAYSALAETARAIRQAPPGYPCASCTGSGVSRLGSGPCTRCRGGGIDVRAMRPVTG